MSAPSISIIVAMTTDRVIGKDNRLPWHIPEDLKRFKQITMGHPLIMGRRTFDSIRKPLPGRVNIILTRNSRWTYQGVTVASALADALKSLKGEVFVIGGADVFRAVLPVTQKIYLTLIHQEFGGDVFFPKDWDQDFIKTEEAPVAHSQKGNIPYQFITYARK